MEKNRSLKTSSWKTDSDYSPYQLFRDLTAFGSFLFYSFLLLLALAFQEFSLFLKLLLGLIFIMVVSVLIRMVYFKHRPRKQNHTNFIEKIDASSFPSIHTARIVFLALTGIFLFPNPYFSALLILLALLTSYSRVYLRKHDWLDLAGGAVLAIIAFVIISFL